MTSLSYQLRFNFASLEKLIREIEFSQFIHSVNVFKFTAKQVKMSEAGWNLKKTEFGRVTINPLRRLWERNQPQPNPEKSSIILQAGDPTVFGNFLPHPECAQALREALDSDKFSYNESVGNKAAREAVAKYSSHMGNITANDVFITNGCSMAIEMCFWALANPGENILIPCPAWNYITWLSGARIEPRFYKLDPDKGWDVDLKYMESLIDEKTRAIVVNSPGNPCGNVFSKEHILEILEIAERHRLPIIADEIYEFFTFSGLEFHSVASLSKNVPVLSCSGLTKRFLIPGIRIDWLIINDRGDKLKDIREGLINISGRNFGPNSTIQLALPKILQSVPQSYFDDSKAKVGVSKKLKLPVQFLI